MRGMRLGGIVGAPGLIGFIALIYMAFAGRFGVMDQSFYPAATLAVKKCHMQRIETDVAESHNHTGSGVSPRQSLAALHTSCVVPLPGLVERRNHPADHQRHLLAVGRRSDPGQYRTLGHIGQYQIVAVPQHNHTLTFQLRQLLIHGSRVDLQYHRHVIGTECPGGRYQQANQYINYPYGHKCL